MSTAARPAASIVIWHRMSFDLEGILSYLPDGAPIRGIISADSIHRGGPDERSPLGIPRLSDHRRKFYLQAVTELHDQYAARKMELISVDNTLLEYIKGLSQEEIPETVLVSPPRGTEEREDFAQLEREFKTMGNGPKLGYLPENCLISEDELPFAVDEMPRTFSAFRRKIEKRDYSSYRFASYEATRRLAPGGGRTRLEEYLFASDGIASYKETRNGLGSGDYSSRLSPWLSVDALRAKEVGRRVRDYEDTRIKNESTYWLIFELLWRDFFIHLAKAVGPRMFHPRGFKKIMSPGLAPDWRTDPDVWTRFCSWAMGKTGQDFIDAIMRELYATGETSNRARQNAASYLIHDLGCPWWWGAWWFEHLLIDYDPPSNWGNWAYLAGVGADPRPSRRFNVSKQAASYDPKGSYRSQVRKMGWQVPADALPATAPMEAMAQVEHMAKKLRAVVETSDPV